MSTWASSGPGSRCGARAARTRDPQGRLESSTRKALQPWCPGPCGGSWKPLCANRRPSFPRTCWPPTRGATAHHAGRPPRDLRRSARGRGQALRLGSPSGGGAAGPGFRAAAAPSSGPWRSRGRWGLWKWVCTRRPGRSYGGGREGGRRLFHSWGCLPSPSPRSARDHGGGVVLQTRPHVAFSGLTRNKKNRVC